ncbi:MAG: hypothetical protein ABJA66_03605 [Actinomycetota bacterium]
MSIFEDLIEELKEEQLLEATVIEIHKEKTDAENIRAEQRAAENSHFKAVADFETSPLSGESFEHSKLDGADLQKAEFLPAEEVYPAEEVEFSAEPILLANTDLFTTESQLEGNSESTKPYYEVERTERRVSEKEYFRKRAMDEVTGLQMVEHVISCVEREQMKTVPEPYDDLPVKLVLHDFIQIAHDPTTTEHAQAEFRLMQETENWYSALSHRDKNITVAHLRRYCETTRPALSAQALISLARFYRNSPYSESVRSKFDLVMTRLFSREIEYDQRELLLTHEEMIQQLKELYSDWSSIQLYSSDEQDSEILISKLKFEDFITEAENTNSFEEIITNDFFNRLRAFKESCQENFFAPLVAVSAIESNIRIGNRYIDLLQKEKENSSSSSIEEKYGFLHDQAISDATGKTLQLVELLREKNEQRKSAEIVEVSVKQQERTSVRIAKKPRNKLYSVNKWLLAATILTVLVCSGLYFWAEYETQETTKVSPGVVKVSLENSVMKDYIQTARITDETFFGITLASWENLNSEKKEDLLKKILDSGNGKGFKKVHLINTNGKSVGFASNEKVEVYHQ